MDKTISVNGKEYEIEKLLGKGKGGYSYLVNDGQARFVVKQIHHEPCDYYTFGNKLEQELGDYEKLRAVGIRIPQLYEVDKTAERILKEYIDGATVAQLAERGELAQKHIDEVRRMSKLLFDAGLNIDYYPTNFIDAADGLYYIDYECNPYSDKWSFENWGLQYWTVSKP